MSSDGELAKRQPVVFLGHGSPMHAIANNAFTQTLSALGRSLPRPRAIVCISAHWSTRGTQVTHMPQPKTIHDFYGFPAELFAVNYPAPGSSEIAELVANTIRSTRVHLDDHEWGLDHGTWSVLRHVYPHADIPILQLSLDLSQAPAYHFAIGQELRRLRDANILLIGSGNIVHNLRKIDFNPNAKPFDWAIEFDDWVKTKLEHRDFAALVEQANTSPAGKLSIPTPEHWYPLLYTLGAATSDDPLHFDYTAIEHGSIAMRCLRFG